MVGIKLVNVYEHVAARDGCVIKLTRSTQDDMLVWCLYAPKWQQKQINDQFRQNNDENCNFKLRSILQVLYLYNIEYFRDVLKVLK